MFLSWRSMSCQEQSVFLVCFDFAFVILAPLLRCQLRCRYVFRRETCISACECGLIQFRRMPFELANAPATFQRLIDSSIAPQMDVSACLGDVIIEREISPDHLYWLDIVLKNISDPRLEVNLDKSEFCCTRVTYLGLRSGPEGL